MSRLPAIRRWAAALTIACAVTPGAGAQERGAAALGPLVAGLGTSARVLVVGAHPDDDAPALIAFLARGRHARVAYLSLTRGEGGGNVIGGEGSEALGVLRTEELLAARRVDGGESYFTRAFDFGVSKSVDETRQRWWGEGQLGDVVRIVRAFRPHVIVSVHDTTDGDPHAHHRVAGLLAREAFEAAASDTTRYKRGGWGQPWRALKLYQLVPDSAGADGAAVDTTATLRVAVGEYAPLLGRSYAEVGAEARGKQRSQGLGVVGRAGARSVGLRLLASRVPVDAGAERSTFAGIDTTFARLRRDGQDPAVAAAIDSIAPLVARAQSAYRADDPSAAAEPIAALVTLAARAAARAGLAPPGARFPAPADADVARSLEDLWRRAQDALVLASGVAVEATAERELVAQATATDSSDTLRVSVAVFNRGRSAVGVDLALLSNAPNARAVPRATVLPDSAWRGAIAGAPRTVTQPWWREGGRIDDMYSADVDGRPEEERATSPESGAVRVTTRLRIAGAEAYVTVPVVRRTTDPVRGEQARPVAVAPGITARFERAAEYARAGTPLVRPLRVTLRSAYGAPREVVVSLVLQNAAQGLRVDSGTRRVALPAQGTRVVTFLLRGTPAAGDYNLRAVAMVRGDTAAGGGAVASAAVASAAKVARYDLSGGVVEYDHIAPQRMYYQVAMRLRAARVTVPANLAVGYVSGGVGDPTPSALTQLGIPVTPIDPAALLLPGLDLGRFGAIVVGPRAYATRPDLLDVTPVLHEYARAGGTLVVQQGQYELAQGGVLPFPVTYTVPAQRVTREDAPVGLLEPRAPVLRAPNAIVDADFQGWVHERAAFMPSAFDPRWRAALAMSDPDEPLNRAGILVAPMGRGAYVYTTLSFPRQFAAAHGGAARLFVNLLAARPPAAAAARSVE